MSDRFKLTFNKPAVRQFLEGDDKGLRIRVDNGVVMFKTSKSVVADAAPLEQRTRGGIEAIVEGESAASVLENLNNPAGPFYVLKRRENGWVAAEPYGGADAPPKFEPHVRVWTAREKTAEKPVKKKAKVGRRVKVSAAPTIEQGVDTPYLDKVRSAYGKLSEAARPGRPSNEERQGRMEARDIVASFEATAKELMGLPTDSPHLDLSGLITAHKIIGDFINLMEHKTDDAPVEQPALKTDDAAAHTAKASSKTKASAAVSDDQQAEEMSRAAMAKLGLTDHDAPKPSRRRQTAHSASA